MVLVQATSKYQQKKRKDRRNLIAGRQAESKIIRIQIEIKQRVARKWQNPMTLTKSTDTKSNEWLPLNSKIRGLEKCSRFYSLVVNI